MKERPILFSGLMVRAILSGLKTQTRRVIKPQPYITPEWDEEEQVAKFYAADELVGSIKCPYGQPGDRLWVREAWRSAKDLDSFSPASIGEKCVDQGYRKPWAPVQYETDGLRVNWDGWGLGKTMEDADAPGRLRASMHMPRWACRLVLEIVSVRVERLHGIRETDAMAEGWEKRQEVSSDPAVHTDAARDWFSDLWSSINGPESWQANPWVWVVEFKEVAA